MYVAGSQPTVLTGGLLLGPDFQGPHKKLHCPAECEDGLGISSVALKRKQPFNSVSEDGVGATPG